MTPVDLCTLCPKKIESMDVIHGSHSLSFVLQLYNANITLPYSNKVNITQTGRLMSLNIVEIFQKNVDTFEKCRAYQARSPYQS